MSLKESLTLGKQANKQANKNPTKNQDKNYGLMENFHFLYLLFCIAQDERYISMLRLVFQSNLWNMLSTSPFHEVSVTRNLSFYNVSH